MQMTLTFPFPPTDLNITCRYAGVFHVEKNGRYSISRTEAADLCEAFNTTLPTMAQMELALSKGFETCRYGFIEGHVVIPRIHPNAICAANNTGVYILLASNTSHYDTYCFNASAPLEEDCTSVTDLPNSFDGPVTITIVNRDGTRYSKKGEYRTHQEDIDASNIIDDDVSSGSTIEKSTPEGYILHTDLPTSQPTGDRDDAFFIGSTLATIASTVYSKSHATAQKQNNWIWSWFGNSQSTTQTQEPTTTATTGTESNTNPTGWEPNEENEDETDKYPSFSGSGIDDDEDFISSTIATTPWVSAHTKQNQERTQWKPIHSNPEVLLQTTTRMTDIDRNSTSAHGENWTQEPQPPFNNHEYQDEEETPHSTSTTWAAPNSTAEETATQQEKWFENEWQGKNPPTPSEDSHVTEGTTASAHNNHPSQRMTTQSQEDVSWTDFFDPISHPMGQGHQTESKDTDSSHSTTLQPTAAPNTHLVEDLNRTGPLSATTPKSGARRGGSLPRDTTTSLEGYTPQYPDTMENRTLFPVTPAKTEVFGETEGTVATDSNFNVDDSLPGDGDSSMDPRGGSDMVTHGSELAGHSSGNQDSGVTTTSGPARRPQIPEWLIILASLLALALILAVCIAVNSRRRCGQKKKLVINSGNGTVEDRKPSELNGEASKSQEMVHLVNKEPTETPDQFMTADETRNLQSVDMKIGV
ncbi:CD44 antigen isoform X2 [Rattus rattus]|uniref:CD44 antigen isoform X2 n=1 Tax=Rattus rattus TaxID=10117 RepID=UPI0013F2BD89|nr:CD44 antigen isoform X2 [Rattus rattus]